MTFRDPVLLYHETKRTCFLVLKLWCSVSTPEYVQQLILTNVHSPGQYRVMGTLSNSKTFASAFQCPLGSPMNPVGKCKIWWSPRFFRFRLVFFVLFLFFWLLLMFLPCFILYSLGNVQARQCLHRPIRQYTLNSLFVSAWDLYIWPRCVFFWRLVFYKLLFFWFRVKSSVFCFFFWKNC